MNEEQRYAYLRHTMANCIHDKIVDGKKVDEVEDQLDFFFTEAFFVLSGERVDEKDL